MTVYDIARELRKNEKQKHECDEKLVQMLEEICNDNETSANWFLHQAILFIEQDGFDVSGYSLNWYFSNKEANPANQESLWVLSFIKDEKEFILEVNRSQQPAVSAHKWVKAKSRRSTTRRIPHIQSS